MNNDEEKILLKITDNKKPTGAFNIRLNKKSVKKQITDNVNIISKAENKGLDIIIKEDTPLEFIYLPVILSESGLTDIVYNDFYIHKNAKVYIIAGCAIKTNSNKKSTHNGIHRFFVDEGANVTYIENHYGEGHNHSKIFNPTTEVYLKNNASMEIKTTQIEGVDNSIRITKAETGKNATLTINEKILTNKDNYTESQFEVNLNGENSSCQITSRACATDTSTQIFKSNVNGNNKSFAHIECDAIIKDQAKVTSIPAVNANHSEANLTHEASIGKIAKDEIEKLMTLGLTEIEAEQKIIDGFLK